MTNKTKVFKKLYEDLESNKWIQELCDKTKEVIAQEEPKNLEGRLRKKLKLNHTLAKSDDVAPKILNSAGKPTGGFLDTHNSDLVHGVNLSVDLGPGSTETTSKIQISPKQDGEFAVLKAPLGFDGHRFAKDYNPQLEPYSHFKEKGFDSTHREATFHAIADKVFNMGDFVPKTAVFEHPDGHGTWSAQEYVKDSSMYSSPEQLRKYENSGALHKLAIMEVIAGHQDRNKSNIRIDATGCPKLIDNALSFDFSHLYGTPYPAYAAHLMRSGVPQSVHNWISGLDHKKLIELSEACKMPRETMHKMLDRLAEFKRWSNTVNANPDASRDLGSAIELARIHRFWPLGLSVNEQDMLNENYRRIRRGESIWSGISKETDRTRSV